MWTENSPIEASVTAKRTRNPIRAIVDNLRVVPNENKDMISLALGDPTVFGNLNAPESCVEEVCNQVKSFKANGYPPSVGYLFAREAIAKKFSSSQSKLTADDVIIASGCSGALDLCITVLANAGQNILIPRPGFSLYQTLAESKGVECRYYNLIPEKQWEVDLEHVATLVDEKTAAIVINNPSNPCGSVFSESHLREIVACASQNRIPIIADEIYADMAFEPFKFTPLSEISTEVPILTVGGIAKQYLVPGWRVGWVLIHDRQNLFGEVRKGLVACSQLILGANSLIQAVLPKLLLETPQEFYESTLNVLQTNSRISQEELGKIEGLKVIVPQGAMYVMVGIKPGYFKDISSDLEFTEKLVAEESVFCLPGQCFQYPDYFRVVFTAPPEKLREAYQRISEFCQRHSQ